MKKVYPDAKAALAGLLKDGMLICAGGFGLCGIPETLITRHPRLRGEEPHHRLQQRRRRRRRPRPAAGDQAGQEDDLVLRRREQAVRAAVSRRRARDRIQPAGHARRAHPRRRRRHPGLLHPHRRRHRHRQGQGGARVRRREVHHGARHRRRPVDRARLEGRHRRQSRLSKDRAQLQSDDGDRRQGRRWPRSRTWSSRARSIPTTSSRPAST